MDNKDKVPAQAENHQDSPVAYLVKPLIVSLFFFVLAAALGVILRLAFVIEMPEWLHYKNVQHAHSHIALLGWLFGALYLLIIGAFSLEYRNYRGLYWLLQGSVAGMAISFPIVGYTSISIAFTTIHILLSYVFVYRVWKELDRRGVSDWSVRLLKASLLFLVLSTLGTWALGPIIALGMKGGAWYYGAIQFYLHFQLNGWLVFSMLAIFFRTCELSDLGSDILRMRLFFVTLVIATVLTFALAVTWSTPHPLIFGVNSAGVIIQLVALVILFILIWDKLGHLKSSLTPYSRTMLAIAGIALIAKILIQTAVAIPAVAEISYTIRNFVVGFIHLLMLGCLSLFLFALIAEITGRKPDVAGTWIFIGGVVTTELLLFGQGILLWIGWGFMPGYYLLLGTLSGLILIGVLMNTMHFLREDVKET